MDVSVAHLVVTGHRCVLRDPYTSYKHPGIIFYSFVTSFCARSHSHDSVPGSLHFVSYHTWFCHTAVSERRRYSVKIPLCRSFK